MAVDMYLKCEGGPDGESKDAKHADWHEIVGFSHNIIQTSSGSSRTGGLPGGRADFGDVLIQKYINSGTPEFNILCINGKNIPKVEIEFCLATGDKETFMKYELTNCYISSYSVSGSSADEARPLEEIALTYGEIKWEYTPVDKEGKVGAATDRTWKVDEKEQG